MLTARGLHTATLLANGKVLAVGGHNVTTVLGQNVVVALASAEVYNP